MKRFHVNLAVTNLPESVRFYSQLFASEPTVLKDDYAKWMLDDPRINFAIETRAAAKGISHLGIQVENAPELAELRQKLESAEGAILDQPDVTCCYARSSKAWISDPDGVAWETFLTYEDSTDYGEELLPGETQRESSLPSAGNGCC